MEKIENVYQVIEKGILRLEKHKENENILSIPGELFYESKSFMSNFEMEK